MDQVGNGTEPSTDDAGPLGQSKRSYFIVITLVALAMSALPGLFAFGLIVHVLAPYFGQDYSAQQFWIQTTSELLYVIFPGLFFVVLYFFGKRMIRFFADTYLSVILYLFLGSILGYATYFVLFAILVGQNPIVSTQLWFSFLLNAVSEGLRNVFAGFTALGLSYLRTRNPPVEVKQNRPQ